MGRTDHAEARLSWLYIPAEQPARKPFDWHKAIRFAAKVAWFFLGFLIGALVTLAAIGSSWGDF